MTLEPPDTGTLRDPQSQRIGFLYLITTWMKATLRRQKVVASALIFLAGLVIGACGGSSDRGDEQKSPPPDYAKELVGAPAPLAALHEQSNQLLDGGEEAFEQRIDDLKGYPIVVNVWASWCGPCRAEFPHFQEVSAKSGKKVAFLGVDAADADDQAADLLEQFPVPYPSYKDPKRAISDQLGARGFPATAFFDTEGEMTYTKIGAFRDKAELRQAIQQYAIKGETN